ncbi:tail fiber assembly protein [Klebsiella pneumoniae]|uniref:tail fiber assembly protein n=1 Tax=Klebsiella pneumoniae TaxID=573 RepID=UPI001F4AFB51|nr:tail fiber assembly protein [Klebsiella pneumoniae]HBW3346571.1 tail fiber assembly protein [Klebsiella pneumoniae]
MNINDFTNIRNPRYASEDGKLITVTADIATVGEGIDFTANREDCTDYGPLIHAAAVAGEYGVVAEYSVPKLTEAQIVAQNTQIYNQLLRACTDAAFPLQSAITLGIATEAQQTELAQLQQYAVDLRNTDLTADPAAFPEFPVSVSSQGVK